MPVDTKIELKANFSLKNRQKIFRAMAGKLNLNFTIVYLENAWTSNQMITEGEAAILLETTSVISHNRNKDQLKLLQKIQI